MTYGISSALAAAFGGHLVNCIPQFVIVYISLSLLMSTVLFLMFWNKKPSYILTFVPTLILELCEGMCHFVPASEYYYTCSGSRYIFFQVMLEFYFNIKKSQHSVLFV